MAENPNRARIDAMYKGDRLWSIVLLLLLILSVGFVFLMVLPFATPEILGALVVGGGLLIILNTASIIAMISHYSEDRDHIYGLDIHYLDQMNK